MNTPKALSNLQGFTLIELIVTITVMAIIASIAVPSMQQQIQQSLIQDNAGIIESALKEARTQALIAQTNTQMSLVKIANNKKIILSYANSLTNLSEYKLNDNISIITTPADLTVITFTPNKLAYQGDGSASLKADNTTKFSVCYGKGTTKYSISVDANSNIVSYRDGACI